MQMDPARLLIGLGNIGTLLVDGREVPVTELRQSLVAAGFASNEISQIFEILRQGQLQGIRPSLRLIGSATYVQFTTPVEF